MSLKKLFNIALLELGCYLCFILAVLYSSVHWSY